MKKYADLHCHPHLRSFNWLRNSRFEKRKSKFHPWHVVASRIKSEKKGMRANAYSQSDMIKLVNGGMKLAFVSLYPMEKGWFRGRPDIPDNVYRKAIRSITNNKAMRWLADLYQDGFARFLMKVGKGRGPKIAFRDLLQGIFMKLPERRIQFIQGNSYSYFDELQLERDFLLTKNNVATEAEVFLPNFKNIFLNKKKLLAKSQRDFKAEGTYEIVRSKDDLVRIDGEEGKIAFVFTIEGSNVFNTDEPLDSILPKIKQVKEWTDTPVFFISFSHHFNNFLCGHAHSIPDYGGLIMDQAAGMNEGFTEKGKKVIRYLLNLDDDNRRMDIPERRILIDVKHMSATSRKYYYESMIKPCRELYGDNIPVIASHVAYSGIGTLEELIQNAPAETDADSVSTASKPFNTWNINLSDEDVMVVFESGGIIGLNFDQRILAVPPKDKKQTYPGDYDAKFFWENLKAMMKVVASSGHPEKEKLLDLFALGSDFDGYIDPLDSYATVLEFEKLEQDLKEVVSSDPESGELLFGMDPGTYVEKVFYGNAYDFACRHM
jgi:microsomal dipeptidase-like Zn-dependent dipeptidase